MGNCQRRSEKGRAVYNFADARGPRAEGCTSQHLCQLCEYGFKITLEFRIRTEQRAGRWRAAKYPLRDGKINSMDPDSDNDGLTDGTELGVTVPVPGTSTIGGTNVSAYMDDGGCLRKNFTADVDPSTTTNVTLCDTDGDGFYDGWVDDGDGIYEEGYGEYLGEDLNYDGNRDSTEMDPTDRDTDEV